MNNFSDKTKNMTYSYSRLSAYNTCPLSFKFTYIDKENRLPNAFGEYGILSHDCIERFFKNEIGQKNLANYYNENFDFYVLSDFPPFPRGMRESYRSDGQTFFENIDFDISLYEILFIEKYFNYEYKDIKIVVRPDILLKEKNSGKIILLDLKTSKLYNNSKDKDKLENYLKQMYLYAYIVWLSEGIAIDEIWIWFIRNNIFKKYNFNQEKAFETMDWVSETFTKIQLDTTWKPNLSKSNKYFCNWICSNRETCPFSPRK
jgi:hypothetical protein